MNPIELHSPGPPPQQQPHYLRFASLFNPGKAVLVPCDAGGRVDMDGLSEALRVAYLGARALVGRDYAYPVMDPLH